MDQTALKEEIKLNLTGYVLEMEIDDATLDRIIQSSLREIQRYICSTRLITIPYKNCIDLSDPENTNKKEIKVSSVSRVFRAESLGTSDAETTDPASVSIWQSLYGLGNMQNFQNTLYNMYAWNTLLQMRNTTSTDMAFRFDRENQQLYINASSGNPVNVTLEYVPRCDSVEDVTSDYWIDILVQMAVAKTKIVLGRIRTRFTESNALWTQDGQTILEEGNTEYNNLREHLKANTQLVYPID